MGHRDDIGRLAAELANRPWEFARAALQINLYSQKEIQRIVNRARMVWGDVPTARALAILTAAGIPA